MMDTTINPIDIPTEDGVMNGYIIKRSHSENDPLVVYCMDSCGIQQPFLDMAARLASLGYVTIVPNFYYRQTRYFDVEPNRLFEPGYEDKLDMLWRLNRGLTNTMAARDVAAAIDWARQHEAAKSGRVGVVGYCLGGRIALAAAGQLGDRIAAAASIHGGSILMEAPDAVQNFIGNIDGEIYMGCAEIDEYMPQEALDRLEALFRRHGTRHRIDVYPGTHHGFALLARDTLHQEAYDRHWTEIDALLKRNLN